MKKIGIIYFSATGNTKFVSENIKAELEENNIEADLINIEKDEIEIGGYESLIIGGPVYVEKYPSILFKYIDRISKFYKGKCMLFTTQAGVNATSAFQDFINRESYLNVTYCEFVTMPNNFYNFMFKRQSEEEKIRRISDSRKVISVAVKSFLEGKKKFYLVSRRKLFPITMIYKMFYPFLARIMINKIKIDRSKCIKCKLCEKRCPVGAINIDDGVKINSRCLLCQRCMSSCPKDVFWYKNKKYEQYKLK